MIGQFDVVVWRPCDSPLRCGRWHQTGSSWTTLWAANMTEHHWPLSAYYSFPWKLGTNQHKHEDNNQLSDELYRVEGVVNNQGKDSIHPTTDWNNWSAHNKTISTHPNSILKQLMCLKDYSASFILLPSHCSSLLSSLLCLGMYCISTQCGTFKQWFVLFDPPLLSFNSILWESFKLGVL